VFQCVSLSVHVNMLSLCFCVSLLVFLSLIVCVCVENAGPTGSIFIYSNYEPTILKSLSRIFPDYSEALLGLCDRMVDLLKPIRSYYYHPELHGSFSLKSVLPVLVPEMGYSDLSIADGSSASLAYATMIARDTPEAERETINSALLAYCERDTKAMVQIFRALYLVTDRKS